MEEYRETISQEACLANNDRLSPELAFELQG